MVGFPDKKYDIIYVDPPWPYYGDPNKWAAAGKHYKLMTMEQITGLPVRELTSKRAALFLWATCPRLHFAIDAIRAWNFHYQGVAFVWVKTRKDGAIIGAQGVMPTFVKPTTELLLVASTNKRGRPFPILTMKMRQVVLHPRLAHSVKPDVFRDNIVELLGHRPRIELFARKQVPGWDSWGMELK